MLPVFANDEKKHLCLALKLPTGKSDRVGVRRRKEKRDQCRGSQRSLGQFVDGTVRGCG